MRQSSDGERARSNARDKLDVHELHRTAVPDSTFDSLAGRSAPSRPLREPRVPDLTFVGSAGLRPPAPAKFTKVESGT